MNYMITPYAIAQFAAALVSMGLSVVVWHRRRARGGIYILFLFIAVSIWTFANSMEAAAVTQELKISWSKVAYIGSQTSPAFLLLYAFEYTGRKYILSEFKIGILFIIPIFIILMAATNESHALIWTAFTPGPEGTNSLIYHHGILFWGAIAYIFFLIFVASYLLLFSTVGSQRIYKQQNRMIVLATIIPWIGSVLYFLDLNPFPGLDLVSLSFLFTGLALLVGISRLKLMDVVPVSHEFLIENFEDGILVVDEKFRIIEINSSAEKLLKNDRNELIGKPVKDHLPFWEEIFPRFNTTTSEKTEIQLNNPGVEYLQVHITPLPYSQRTYLGWVLVMENITLRKKAELELQETKKLLEKQLSEVQLLQRKLHDQAIHDTLTGTFNRAYLDDTLFRELARAERNGHALSIMMIDVDNFKFINDTYGHKAGDIVIAGIGRMLVEKMRTCDYVCRYGGDEFIVVAPEMKKENAIIRAEKWRDSLKKESFMVEGKAIAATISIGIAVYPENGKDADNLIGSADKAMYQAKADGRDCIRFY